MVDRSGRYSEAGQFLTAAAGVPAAAAPGILAGVLLGAAWSAYHLGDNGRASPLAADGVTRARQSGEPQLEAWGRNLLAGLAWAAGDADRVVAEIEASRSLSGPADPALGARAQVLLANASFLSGDLAEQDLHGRRAIELARTAAGYPDAARLLAAAARPGSRCSTWPPDSPPTATRPHMPPARPGTYSATTGSPRHRKKARDSPSTTRSPTPPARAAAANAPPPAGPA